MPDSSTCFAPAPSRRARVGGSVVVFDDGVDLRLLGVRPLERGEPGAQLRVGLGGPAPGQRAPRAVEQQCPSEPVVSGQQRGAPPRLERDLAGRSDVRYADVTQHFVEPLDGFLNRSTVHPRTRGEAARGRRSIRRVRGPSPRARGGRERIVHLRRVRGTIPARAGADRSVTNRERLPPGPSPRARGGPRLASGRRRWGGSIPAPRARGADAAARRSPEQLGGSSPLARGGGRRRRGAATAARVHPRARWRSPKRPLHASTWAGAIYPGGRGAHLLLASAEAARGRGMHRAARRPG